MQQLEFFEVIDKPTSVCLVCKKIFEKTKCSHKIYCSAQCQSKDYYIKNKKRILERSKERDSIHKGLSVLEKAKIKIKKKKCLACEKSFETNKFWHLYCSYDCQNVSYARNYRKYRTTEWRENNRKYQKIYRTKNKYVKNLRDAIHTKIINNSKTTSKKILEYLGCTIQEARNHIQSQFKEGMTWEKHGRHGWHFDHIIPISHFDATDKEQLKKCFHYTNLQPLWWHENLSKGIKILS